MSATQTNRLADGMVRCTPCGGDFPRLDERLVDGCVLCAPFRANPEVFAPSHFSSDACQSGGPRQHAGCSRRKSHCTCDRCF